MSRSGTGKRQAEDASSSEETTTPSKKKQRSSAAIENVEVSCDWPEHQPEQSTHINQEPSKNTKRKGKSGDSGETEEEEEASARPQAAKKLRSQAPQQRQRVQRSERGKGSKGKQKPVTSSDVEGSENGDDEGRQGASEEDASSSEEWQEGEDDEEEEDEDEGTSGEPEEKVVKVISSKTAKKKTTVEPSKPPRKPSNAGPKPGAANEERLTPQQIEYNIWTKGFEALDSKLGVTPGVAREPSFICMSRVSYSYFCILADWEPFVKVTHSGGVRSHSWKIHPKGKEWLMARYNSYVYPPKNATPYDKKRAKVHRKKWRASIARVYHSLWPNLNLLDYGTDQHPRTAYTVCGIHFVTQYMYIHYYR